MYLNEDTEAVEGDAAPEAAVETSMDSGGESISADPEPTETVESESSDESETLDIPDVFDWNGEVDSLQSADWFGKLDESLRDPLIKGIESKYQNWQRGYTNKFQDVAKQRREAENLLKEVKEQELRVQRWLHGDVDPMVEKQKEVDNMKVAHQAAIQALRNEAQDAHEKATHLHGEALVEAQRERDSALDQMKGFQTQVDAIEAKQVETQVDHLEKWLTTEASDVYENDEAFDLFCKMVDSGHKPETVVAMVRAVHPPPQREVVPEPEPEPVPEPVPQGMKLMNMGPASAEATEGGDPRSYDEMMENMRKNAMIEQELLLRG